MTSIYIKTESKIVMSNNTGFRNNITIIIPAYNCENTISRCIESFRGNGGMISEIIVVNDGSSDKTEAIANGYRDEMFNIRVVNQENSGPSSARNRGIQECNTEYLMFVDSDDYVDEGYLQDLAQIAKKGYLIGGNFRRITSDGKTLSVVNRTGNGFKMSDIISGRIGGYVWGYLFEKRIAESILFDSDVSFMEDTLFLHKYIKKMNGVVFGNCFYNYVINGESITLSEKRIITNISTIDFVLDSLQSSDPSAFDYRLIFKKKLRLIDAEIAKAEVSNIKCILNDKNVKSVLIKNKDNSNGLIKFCFSVLLHQSWVCFAFYRMRPAIKLFIKWFK